MTSAGPEGLAWAGSPAAACRAPSLARRRCKCSQGSGRRLRGPRRRSAGAGGRRRRSPCGARPTAGHSLGEMEPTPGRHDSHRARGRSPQRHSTARRGPEWPGVRPSPRGRGPTSRRSLRDALLRRDRKSRPDPAGNAPPGRLRPLPQGGSAQHPFLGNVVSARARAPLPVPTATTRACGNAPGIEPQVSQ